MGQISQLKAEIEKTDLKSPAICYLQKTYLDPKSEVDWKNDGKKISQRCNQKRVGVAILISD